VATTQGSLRGAYFIAISLRLQLDERGLSLGIAAAIAIFPPHHIDSGDHRVSTGLAGR
jgi:hypothetical protein